MPEARPGCPIPRAPDDNIEPEARKLIESVEDALGFEHGGWAPEWSQKDTDEQWFAEEAPEPAARLTASYVLDRMMGSFQYPYLRQGKPIDPLLIWQSYDTSRTIVTTGAPTQGRPVVEITLGNVLGAAMRAEAWFQQLNQFYDDDSHDPDIRDYQMMQRSITQALTPVDPPALDANP